MSIPVALLYLAIAGALASWIVGVVAYARTLSALPRGGVFWQALVAWPFAVRRMSGAAAASAAVVNRALLAFFVFLLLAIVAVFWLAAPN